MLEKIGPIVLVIILFCTFGLFLYSWWFFEKGKHKEEMLNTAFKEVRQIADKMLLEIESLQTQLLVLQKRKYDFEIYIEDLRNKLISVTASTYKEILTASVAQYTHDSSSPSLKELQKIKDELELLKVKLKTQA